MLRMIASLLVGMSVSAWAGSQPEYVLKSETNLTHSAGLPQPYGAIVFNQKRDAFVYAAVEAKLKPFCVLRYVELDKSSADTWIVKRTAALSSSLRCDSKWGFIPGDKYAFSLGLRPNALKVFSLDANPRLINNDLKVGDDVYWTGNGSHAFTTLPHYPNSFWYFEPTSPNWLGNIEMISEDFTKWTGNSTLKDWFIKSGMVELFNNHRLNQFIGETSLDEFLGKNPIKNLEAVKKLRRIVGTKKLKDVVSQADFQAWADENGLTGLVNTPVRKLLLHNNFDVEQIVGSPVKGSQVLVVGRDPRAMTRYQVRIWDASTQQWQDTKMDWRVRKTYDPSVSARWSQDGRFIILRKDNYPGGWDWKSRLVQFELWDATGKIRYRTDFFPVSFPRSGWGEKWDRMSDHLDWIDSSSRSDLVLLAYYTKAHWKKSSTAHLTLDLREFPTGKQKAKVNTAVSLHTKNGPIAGVILPRGRVLAYFDDKWVAWNPGDTSVQYIREPGTVAAVLPDPKEDEFETLSWEPGKGLLVHSWELK